MIITFLVFANKRSFGSTIEEGLRFRHKPYIYLYSPEEEKLT
jgi:hypothetical protein